MPRDLFGDVVVRPASFRSRRSPLLLLSLVAHATALVLGVVGSLLAAPSLPGSGEFREGDVVIFPADIELPSPDNAGGSLRRASSPTPATTVVLRAPVDAPGGIAPENPGLDPGAPIGADLTRIERDGRPGLSGLVQGAPLPPSPPPTASGASTTTAIRLHSGIRAPQKIFNLDPAYPPMARSAHVEGVVILEVTVDISGAVTGLRVLRPVPLLDQAAIEAVRQWKFTPALLNGDPVPVFMTITVRFTLGGEQR
jgi:protein TonB